MSKCQKILVAIDFSDSSARTTEKAQELADLYGADLYITSVIEPLPAIAYSYSGGLDIQDDMLKSIKQKMSDWGKKYDIAEDKQTVELGYPKTDIIAAAEELKADLIVVGSHGHYGPIKNILGSTARAIVNHSNCNVYVVRCDE